MQADEHITSAGDDSALAMALAQAVRAVGRNLAADPRRVQAMVRDVLGSESRTRRAEIDAVVLAAEEAVPEDLLAERIDVSAAVDRLNDRGLAPDVSLFAVAVWRYALGLLADNAEPPTLTNSVERSSDPAPTSLTSVPPQAAESSSNRALAGVSSQPTDIIASTHDELRMPQPTSLEAREAAPSEPVASGGTARRWWIPAVVVAAVLAGMLVFLLARGGSDEPEASPRSDVTVAPTSAAPSTTAAPSTSAAPSTLDPAAGAPPASAAPTTNPPVATAPPLPGAQFAAEQTDVGDATRTWTVDGQQLTGVVQIANAGEAAVEGWYYEVLPKSMVTNLDQVTSLDATELFPFLADPVVRYFVEIPPHGSMTVGYVVTLPAAPTQAEIDTWKVDQGAATTEFRAAAPALTFDTASGGVVTSPGVELFGTAPGAEMVTIDGVAVEGFEIYKAGGQWWQPLSGLRPGVNEFTVIATSPYGVQTTLTWTVDYRPPTTTTTPRRSGGGGSSGGGSGGGGGGETPAPTTTTGERPEPPPP